MEIVNLDFEETLYLTIQGHTIELITFEPAAIGSVSIGISAPCQISIDREEIYKQKILLNKSNR